jgi:hypothetical protein
MNAVLYENMIVGLYIVITIAFYSTFGIWLYFVTKFTRDNINRYMERRRRQAQEAARTRATELQDLERGRFGRRVTEINRSGREAAERDSVDGGANEIEAWMARSDTSHMH